VVKKARLIFIIAIILVVAGICGYGIIYGIDFGNFLKENGIYSPSPSAEPIDSTADRTTEEQGQEKNTDTTGKSLEKALNELYTLDSEALLNMEYMTFHRVLGRDVGTDGLAESWVIGAIQDGQNLLLSYDSGGWREMEWPGPLSGETIDPGNITTPQELYTLNSDIIIKIFREANVSYSDLSLEDGIYIIKIQKGDSIVKLKFKADTGELI
jgi:hypothetical protein